MCVCVRVCVCVLNLMLANWATSSASAYSIVSRALSAWLPVSVCVSVCLCEWKYVLVAVDMFSQLSPLSPPPLPIRHFPLWHSRPGNGRSHICKVNCKGHKMPEPTPLPAAQSTSQLAPVAMLCNLRTSEACIQLNQPKIVKFSRMHSLAQTRKPTHIHKRAGFKFPLQLRLIWVTLWNQL